jgi:hypothetical protein
MVDFVEIFSEILGSYGSAYEDDGLWVVALRSLVGIV